MYYRGKRYFFHRVILVGGIYNFRGILGRRDFAQGILLRGYCPMSFILDLFS